MQLSVLSALYLTFEACLHQMLRTRGARTVECRDWDQLTEDPHRQLVAIPMILESLVLSGLPESPAVPLLAIFFALRLDPPLSHLLLRDVNYVLESELVAQPALSCLGLLLVRQESGEGW